MIYITRFTVVGKTQFPTDMLRYDQAWPYTSNDANALLWMCGDHSTRGKYLAHQHDNAAHITLEMFSKNGSGPEKGRWSSFLWSVDPDSISTEKIK